MTSWYNKRVAGPCDLLPVHLMERTPGDTPPFALSVGGLFGDVPESKREPASEDYTEAGKLLGHLLPI